MNKLINIVAVILVVAIAILSRPSNVKIPQSDTKNQYQEYIDDAKTWFYNTIYPQASREVTTVSKPLQQQIATQKNNLFQNIWDQIKNYLAQKFSKVSGTPVK